MPTVRSAKRPARCVALALGLLWAGTGRAADPQPATAPGAARTGAGQYSEFERDVIQHELGARGTELEPDPERKLIESIDIVRLDVFDERDPVPDFLNVFHVTSRERVIRRELLFEIGQRYRKSRIDESARNLRDLRQLSLVLIVPMRGSTPDRVRVLVITKDVWSLRLNFDFQLAGHELTYLLVNPSEENLLGTHTRIGALFILKPDTYSLGALFTNPRVVGSRIQTHVGASIIFNRITGDSEGTFGHFSYGLPLYSLEQSWAWQAAVVWHTEITRRYGGLEPLRFDPNVPGPNPECTANIPRCVPYIYSSERLLSAYEITRSYGRRYKNDVSFGLEADRRVYRPTSALAPYDPAAVRAFVAQEVPLSDQRLSPFVQLHSYTSEFLTVLDFNTLGLQEDYRLGYEVIARMYPASSALGSTRDMLGTLSALSYTLPIGDGLVRVLGASTIEFELHGRHEAVIELGARAVTPRLGFGRFVYDAVLVNRYRNYLNVKSRIGGGVGGDSRLRGFDPLEAFVGSDEVAQNIEFRSRPVEILSAEVGAALFYDSADAFDGFDQMALKQSVGFGVRILFPQASRLVFRADWGFPLTPTPTSPTFPGAVFTTFGQAFDMPAISPPTITSAFETPR